MNSINNLKAKYKIDIQKENVKKGNNLKNKNNKNENKKILPSNKGKISKLNNNNYKIALLYKYSPSKYKSMKAILNYNYSKI